MESKKDTVARDWEDYLKEPLFFDVGREDIGICPYTLKPCADYFIEVGKHTEDYWPLCLKYRVTKEADDLYCFVDLCSDGGKTEVFGLGSDDGKDDRLSVLEFFNEYYPRNKDIRGYVYRDKFLFPVSSDHEGFKYYMNDFGYKVGDGEDPIPYISLFMKVALAIVRDIKENHSWFSEFKVSHSCSNIVQSTASNPIEKKDLWDIVEKIMRKPSV